jgi:RimJ/RimL family protein N-acetyltransferase
MKKLNQLLEGGNVVLRLVQKEDMNFYYESGFRKVDQESMYLTQSDSDFTEEQIFSYVERIIEDESRYDFLIFDSTGVLCGESVLNEINWQYRCANFRIALFDQKYFGKGLGSEALNLTLRFGFEKLALNKIELEVFGFNDRAIRTYKKVGFRIDEIEENVALLDGRLGSILKMSLTKQQYQQ